MTNQKFNSIVKLFQRLPGVGPRQAARFVLALMDRSPSELDEFGTAIKNLRKEVSFCSVCFNISDLPDGKAGNHLCAVCQNSKRDSAKLLVVEKITDLDSIEKTGLYNGLYHVLGGAINPLDGITQNTLRFKELEQRAGGLLFKNGGLELIIATNPTTAGETTSLYIKEMFKSPDWQGKNITLTRLARGLASGSNLEYVDEATLKHALEYRK